MGHEAGQAHKGLHTSYNRQSHSKSTACNQAWATNIISQNIHSNHTPFWLDRAWNKIFRTYALRKYGRHRLRGSWMPVISHDIRFQYHAWSNQLIPKSLWRSFLPELHSLSHCTLIQILMCKDNSYGTNPYLQHHLSPCRYLRGLINWILNYPHKNIFKSW